MVFNPHTPVSTIRRVIGNTNPVLSRIRKMANLVVASNLDVETDTNIHFTSLEIYIQKDCNQAI